MIERLAAHAATHPGRAILAGLTASYLAVGFMVGEIGSAGTEAAVHSRHLVGLHIPAIPELCNADLTTENVTGDEFHLHVGPKEVNSHFGYHQGVPDIFNRGTVLKAQYQANVCTDFSALDLKPDPKHPDKLDLTITSDPDPDKSQVRLIVSIVPGTMEFTPTGDFSNAMLKGHMEIFRAFAQLVGDTAQKVPGDGLDGTLQNGALYLGYDAVGNGPDNCAEMGINMMNVENNPLVKRDPGAPKTILQGLEKIAIKLYQAKNHVKITAKDIIAKYNINPGGIPNQFQKKITAWRAKAKASEKDKSWWHLYTKIQDPKDYPKCEMAVKDPRTGKVQPYKPAAKPAARK